VALACAAEGAQVVVNDYGVSIEGGEPSSEVAEAVVKEIEAAGGSAVAVADDISTMAGGRRVVDIHEPDVHGRAAGRPAAARLGPDHGFPPSARRCD
jgi:NAD(P)-dependent dehydrogenase (short-subunit alcohol dehydrogenase family)